MLSQFPKLAVPQLLGAAARSSMFCEMQRPISTTPPLFWIRLKTRFRVVDNSALGKEAMLSGRPPYCITVMRNCKTPHSPAGRGQLGDKVVVAIKGQVKKAYVVGWHWHPSQRQHGVPRMDTNNIVLLDDQGNPLGTRILAPIPGVLRAKKDEAFAKILAIATKIV